MAERSVLVYYAWSRPEEVGAPLAVIDNRFPALFESRRMLYPRLAELSDPAAVDQGIGGFLDHIMRPNFSAFVAHVQAQTGRAVRELERNDGTGVVALDAALLDGVDTLIVISFDSVRTGQWPHPDEVEAVRRFLGDADHLVAVCPHHDIGSVPDSAHTQTLARQTAEFLHHGDRTIPPQQRFGGYACALLAALGVPVVNRFGLRPAAAADGAPAPILAVHGADRLGLLSQVPTFNLHPHLPHFECLEGGQAQMEVLAQQPLDLGAPPHPFARDGRTCFDALLQSRPGTFAGTLLVGDATLWSSTAGGVESLRQLWSNVVGRRRASFGAG